MSRTEADDILMGGDRSPAIKFPEIGHTVKGVVLSKDSAQVRDFTTGEPKTWPDGNPQMQVIVVLQTDERDPEIDDDDGRRRLFIKGQMLNAVRDAVLAAKIKTLTPGCELVVRYEANGKPKQRGMQPPKIYAAKVTPGTLPEPVDPFGDDDEAPF